MNKRKLAGYAILIALAVFKRRALFLFLMEFLSGGGLWVVLGIIYIVWLLKGGKKAVLCLVGYMALCTLLWFSNASYAPHGMDFHYEEQELVSLAENLIKGAKENHTEEFEVLNILEKAPEAARVKSGKIIAFPYPEILDKMNLSGIFVPFTGCAYINTNEKPFLLPFVSVHELSHRKGFLNEGQANIEAFINCMNSDQNEFRYSACVYALKYALDDLKNRNEAEFLRLESTIPLNILNDLNQMSVLRKNAQGALNNYADLIPGLIFCQSITSQGVI